jgi:2-hydroxy-6-oxonona-2,4-dienedioate hydrolase
MMPLCRERIGTLVLKGSSAGGPTNPVSENLIPWRNEPDSDRRRALHRHNLGVLMIADCARIDDQAVDLHAANAERTRLRSRPLHRTANLAAQLRAAPPQRLAALWGARDALLAGHDAERIALLRSFHPEAEVAIVPDTGHWLQYETPGPANSTLLGLL